MPTMQVSGLPISPISPISFFGKAIEQVDHGTRPRYCKFLRDKKSDDKKLRQ